MAAWPVMLASSAMRQNRWRVLGTRGRVLNRTPGPLPRAHVRLVLTAPRRLTASRRPSPERRRCRAANRRRRRAGGVHAARRAPRTATSGAVERKLVLGQLGAGLLGDEHVSPILRVSFSTREAVLTASDDRELDPATAAPPATTEPVLTPMPTAIRPW